MSVRQLFRNKLENADVIPDASVRVKLMRTLARREFVRFNPGRFNIWYLGGILLVTISGSILLFSKTGKTENMHPVTNTLDSGNTAAVSYFNILAGTRIIRETENAAKNSGLTGKNQVNPGQDAMLNKEAPKKGGSGGKNSIISNIDNSSFPKRNLFTESGVDNKKLRSRARKADVFFEPSVSSGCIPLKIHFYSNANSSDSCTWTFGDGGYSNSKDPDWIFDVEGEYTVDLHVFGPDRSKSRFSTVIKVHPRPGVHFEIAPEKAVIPDDEIRFINYSTGGMNYKWDFGDGATSGLFEPRHTYSKFDNYNIKLTVSSEFGCKDSLIVYNAFSGSKYFIDFPNAFIPNSGGPSGGSYSRKSDETTQVFHPNYSGVSDYQLKIFSKLGILLFESNDVNIGWDGYFKGELSNPGVYIWKVRGNFRNGETFIKMGDVTLLGN